MLPCSNGINSHHYSVDGAEAWLMELIGKGAYEKGAVWVATKVPDGAVLAHANQARTTVFAQDDPENVLFSPDVVSYAQNIGLYPKDAPDAAFDFSAAYDPVTFSARWCPFTHAKSFMRR